MPCIVLVTKFQDVVLISGTIKEWWSASVFQDLSIGEDLNGLVPIV